jgi:protein-disulfide isomerase
MSGPPEHDTRARRRRLYQLGGLVVLAAAVVAILVALSSGGGGKSTSPPKGGHGAAGVAATRQLLGGIPEQGLALGSPKAPVTLVEFNDMQCPICQEYTLNVFPTLVQRYVRTGKVRMEMRLQSFIGPGSVTGGKAVAAAANQDRAWLFQDLFYRNQGEENSGYVTPAFLRKIAAGTPGLDVGRLLSDMTSPAAAQALKAGSAAFDKAGFNGTPSFLVGHTGGPMSELNWSELTPEQFTGPIDSLLSK